MGSEGTRRQIKVASRLDKDLSRLVRKSAKGSFVLILGQFISTLISAVGVIVIARFLGSTSYGQVSVAMIPISIALLFSDLGINSALVRHLSQYRHEENYENLKTYMRAGLLINASVGMVFSIIIYALSGFLAYDIFHQPDLDLLIKIGSISILAQNMLSTTQSIFIGFERMELQSYTTILYAILKTLLGPVLIWLGYGPLGAIIGLTLPYIVAASFGMLFIVILIMRGLKENGGQSLFTACRMMLVYGYPLFFSALLSGGLSQLNSFLMAVYVTLDLVGNYNAALNFGVLISFLTQPISIALFPLFSKLDYRESESLKVVFQSTIKYASLITMPIVIVLVALSDQIIRIVYTRGFSYAPLFLEIYALNFVFNVVGGLSLGNLLNSQGRTDINFRMTLSTLAIGLPLSFLLIPQYGIIGILLIQLVASRPGMFYGLWWIKKNFGFTVDWVSSAKILLVSLFTWAVTKIILSLLGLRYLYEFFLGGFLIVVMFLLLLPLTGTIDRDDIRNIRSIGSTIKPLEPFVNLVLNILEKLMRK
jgi:stage V sporulation protein B